MKASSERIEQSSGYEICRVGVPGGWLYITTVWDTEKDGPQYAPSTTFVPATTTFVPVPEAEGSES